MRTDHPQETLWYLPGNQRLEELAAALVRNNETYKRLRSRALMYTCTIVASLTWVLMFGFHVVTDPGLLPGAYMLWALTALIYLRLGLKLWRNRRTHRQILTEMLSGKWGLAVLKESPAWMLFKRTLMKREYALDTLLRIRGDEVTPWIVQYLNTLRETEETREEPLDEQTIAEIADEAAAAMVARLALAT